MKVSFVFKALFKNYRIILILLILGYIYQFTQLKWRALPQAIQNVIDTWILNGTLSERMAQLPPLVYQIAASLILWVCVYSGIIYLCRKIICDEPANMGDFAVGVEKNLKNVLEVIVLFTLTFGLAKNILQGLVGYIPLEDGIVAGSVKSALTASLSLFCNALVIYGSIFMIEKGVKLRGLFTGAVKFIFSKEAIKLFLLMLFAGFLLMPVYILMAYYFHTSLAGGLGGFLDIISAAKVPVWIKCLEWLIDTVIKAFTVMYVSSLFYERPVMSEAMVSAPETDSLRPAR